MYCKNCGKLISERLNYCPNCGTKFHKKADRIPQSTNQSHTWHREGLLLLAVFTIALAAAFHYGKRSVGANGENQIEIAGDVPAEKEMEYGTKVTDIESESLVGTWRCEAGEVTFTEKGHMMLGRDGIALGGGWLQYEVVDDSTLYLSGGSMPVGINMKYEIDGEYLSLELNGEAIIFSHSSGQQNR